MHCGTIYSESDLLLKLKCPITFLCEYVVVKLLTVISYYYVIVILVTAFTMFLCFCVYFCVKIIICCGTSRKTQYIPLREDNILGLLEESTDSDSLHRQE